LAYGNWGQARDCFEIRIARCQSLNLVQQQGAYDPGRIGFFSLLPIQSQFPVHFR
jgi:hypothetical protein